MSLPIVDRIEDAPETGDCWLREPLKGMCQSWTPVRDRSPLFEVVSLFGWNTKAHHLPRFAQPEDLPGDFLEEISLGGLFAPAAEAAIAAYREGRSRIGVYFVDSECTCLAKQARELLGEI